MTGGEMVCLMCKHYHANNMDGLTCDAFKDGIPDNISLGEPHNKPLPEQDNNIVFEAIEEDR